MSDIQAQSYWVSVGSEAPAASPRGMGDHIVDAAADPNELAEVTVYLKPDETNPLATCHGAICPASREHIEAIVAYAQERGLTVIDADVDHKYVKVRGTVGQLAGAFNVRVVEGIHEEGKFRKRTGPYQMPHQLADMVADMHGLDNRPVAAPRSRRRSFEAHARESMNTAAVPLYPSQVSTAYNCPQAKGDGTGVFSGILSLGGGYPDTLVAEYCRSRGYPKMKVIWIGVDGASNDVNDDPDANGENALDICCKIDVLCKAGMVNATTVVIRAHNTNQGFSNGLIAANKFVDPVTGNHLDDLADSWGMYEEASTAAQLKLMDGIATDGAALGISYIAASGDDGSTDGGPRGRNHVDFTASSPNVWATGATQMSINKNGSRNSEKAWNSGGGATGGGVSVRFGKPAYQSDLQIAGRGVPDASAVGDPISGMLVLTDQGLDAIGGTSACAPCWGAWVCVINSHLKKKLGRLHQFMYSNADCFFDVTIGNNGGYNAGKGWDPVTGLGTPDLTALLNRALAAEGAPALPPPVTPPPPPVVINPPPVDTAPTPVLDFGDQAVINTARTFRKKISIPAREGATIGID